VRTWNFTDGCGNTSENFVQTITVIDNTAPVVQTTTGSLNHTLQCSDASAIAAALAQAPTATDNCTASPTIHLVSDVTTPDANCANAYVRVRTWNFTDGCGNTSENFVQTITVIDNTAPIWSTHSDALNRTLQCSDASGLATAQALAPIATDNCTTTLIPVKTSGTFVSGSCPQSGTYTNTWVVADGCGNTSNIYTQIITIIDTQAPTLTLPADITIYKDAQCHFDATPAVTGSPTNVTDNCDPNPVISHVDNSGFTYNDVQGNVNHGNGYSFPLSIRGMDGLTAADIKSVILDISTNQELSSLEFTLISPSGQGIILAGPYCATCDPGNTGSYKPTFYPASSGYPKWNSSNLITDRNGNYTPSDGTPFANPTPPELTAGYISRFEDFTGPMNGTWTLFGIKDGTSSGHGAFKGITLIPKICEDSEIIIRSWSATDACGNVSSRYDQVVKVLDNTAPVWTSQSGSLDVTLECSDATGLATAQAMRPTASDNCDQTLFVKKTSGAFVPGTCPQMGTYTNTFTVADTCGNQVAAPFVQVITIKDTTAPILSEAPANITVECNAVPTAATLTATDNCDAAPAVTFQEVRTDGTCPNSYILTRTWTATDACGNSSSKTQTITVIDTTAPVLSEAPANVTVECNAVPEPATLTATDNCDVNPTVTFNEVRTDGNCPSNYILTRTWTATDACGNSSSKTQVITVQDTSAPVLSEAPANVTVECNAVPEPATLTATDNCDVNPTVTFNEVRTNGNCPSNYILTRTWTAIDACGNSASKTQVITVQDTSAPVLSEAPANVTVECNAVPEPATLTATDNCAVNPTVTFNEVRTDGNCPSNYILTRTWTATDACGNSSSKTQVITVQDTSAPVLSEAPANVTVECNAVPEPATLTATDNCDVNPTVTFNEVRTDGNCPSNYILTRTWTATDACGNSSSKTQVIKVTDTTPPTLICPPSLTLFTDQDKGFATVTVGQPTVADNCGNVTYSNSHTNTMNASGQYPIGTTTVTWTATDACGNVTTCAQTITVKDNQNPIFTKCWSGESVSFKSASGVHTYTIIGTDWDATAIDNDAIASLTYEMTGATSGSGSTLNNISLNVGVTHIKWTAVDKSGNVSICEYDITVIYGNVPPTAVDDIVTTPEDVTATGNVLTNDSDPDTGNILSVTGFVWNGTSYLPEASVTSQSGTLTLNANGTFSFAPALHYYGSVPAVTYTISDGVGGTASAQLLITVNHVNHSPVARPDAYTTPEGTPISGNVLTNDSDIDGDQVTVKSISISEKQYTTPASVSISNTGNLTVNANGNFTFTPVASFYGDIPTVIYSATDGQASAAATLNIKVSPIPPIAVDDNASVIQNSSVTINVLVNDNYGPAGPATVSLITTNAAHGNVTVENGGTQNNQADDRIIYTPALGYTGSDSFTYTITGSNNLTATATVTITVRPYTDILMFNKRSTVPVNNGNGTVSWKYTISITNKLPNANDAITSIHVTDDLSRVILSPMTFEVVGKTATGNLKINGLFDGVSHTDLLLDGSSVAGNSKDSITIEVRATLNGFYGYIYNQAVMDCSTNATGTISNVLSDDPSNTEASFPRPTRTYMPEILIIPDVITPNQDGHNDRFVIIHSYRLKISMEIFNRWGNKVFESNDYQNDWDGKGSGHLLGKDLPSGTYYYIIVTRNTESGDVNKYAHYLTLKR
jgi:gliding motility-associated-like protein